MDSYQYMTKRNKSKKPDSIANSEKNLSFYENHDRTQDYDYNSEPVFSSNKPNKPKAIITLNIGDSLEQIKVYEGQDLYELARDFANRHDLNEEFIGFLVENIENQMKTTRNDKKSDFSRVDESFISNTANTFQSHRNEKELHYENWQKILKEKLSSKQQIPQPSMNKSPNPSPLRQRSVSPNTSRTLSNVNEKLFNESKYLQNKQKNVEKLKEESELKACSFKPEISENSKKLVKREKSSNSRSIHEKLYEENSFIKEKKEKEQREEFEKLYPFKPEISEYQPIVTKSQKELTARLMNNTKKDKNINMLKKKEEFSFQPKITKDKYYEKAKEKEDIEIENYSNFHCFFDYVISIYSEFRKSDEETNRENTRKNDKRKKKQQIHRKNTKCSKS